MALYGAVSVMAAALEFSFLHGLLLIHSAQPIAVSVAFITAATFQFLMLRYVVFRATHSSVALQANAYALLMIFAWFTVLATVTVLTWALPIGTMEARAIAVPLLFPVNYLINRRLVFRQRDALSHKG